MHHLRRLAEDRSERRQCGHGLDDGQRERLLDRGDGGDLRQRGGRERGLRDRLHGSVGIRHGLLILVGLGGGDGGFHGNLTDGEGNGRLLGGGEDGRGRGHGERLGRSGVDLLEGRLRQDRDGGRGRRGDRDRNVLVELGRRHVDADERRVRLGKPDQAVLVGGLRNLGRLLGDDLCLRRLVVLRQRAIDGRHRVDGLEVEVCLIERRVREGGHRRLDVQPIRPGGVTVEHVDLERLAAGRFDPHAVLRAIRLLDAERLALPLDVGDGAAAGDSRFTQIFNVLRQGRLRAS